MKTTTNEKYGFVKALLLVLALVIGAGAINTLCTLFVYWGYGAVVAYTLPMWFITALLITKDCLVPSISEEVMRQVSCRKGLCSAILYPIVLASLEHFLAYYGEPLSTLLMRYLIHGMLTAIQVVGLGEKKPLLFMGFAMIFHFMNNLNATLYYMN